MGRTLALTTILAAVAAASGMAAAGGPSPGESFGAPGVVGPNRAVRYVTVPAGRGTLVEAIGMRGGQVLRWRFIQGSYGVPLVAYDGSAGGLSRNGRRLVLVSHQTAGVSRFAVLDPRTFRPRARLRLEGYWAFDALSPGGSLMYLIQYVGAPSSGRYAVRALNLNTRKLYSGPIVDRREPEEKMTGQPVTRADSRDAAWAYTLYSRANKGPFVHALDTVHRRAFCVDLPWRNPTNWIGLVRMRLSGGQLLLTLRGKTVASVDTKTFEVSRS
jgi:hypothetical protein